MSTEAELKCCCKLTLALSLCINTIYFLFLCFSVDEDEEYECVTVLNSHTQDVKHVALHPTKEVAQTHFFLLY